MTLSFFPLKWDGFGLFPCICLCLFLFCLYVVYVGCCAVNVTRTERHGELIVKPCKMSEQCRLKLNDAALEIGQVTVCENNSMWVYVHCQYMCCVKVFLFPAACWVSGLVQPQAVCARPVPSSPVQAAKAPSCVRHLAATWLPQWEPGQDKTFSLTAAFN